MYNKIKYLVYISFALFLVLSTIMLSSISEKKYAEKEEISSQITGIEKNNASTENLYAQAPEEENIASELLQRSENEGNVADNLDFSPPAENKGKANIDVKKQDTFYYIRSSMFKSVSTKEEDFGICKKQIDGEYIAAAQILDKSNILLYLFALDNGSYKVLWQKKITNKSSNKEIILNDMTFEKDKLTLSIQEGESESEQIFIFEIDTNLSTDKSVVLNLKEEEISHQNILNPDKSEAKDFVIVDTFTIENKRFHVVGYSDFKNTSDTAIYVKRKFYLYKQNNNTLQYCCFLFLRTTLKDDEIYNMVTVDQDKYKISITYNGKDAVTKIIYKSKLVGPYANFPEGRKFVLGEKNVIEDSNYDLKISEMY